MNDKGGMKNPFLWLFHTSLLVLGAALALNLAIAYLQPVVPWLIGGLGIALLGWCVVSFLRWRRSRW